MQVRTSEQLIQDHYKKLSKKLIEALDQKEQRLLIKLPLPELPKDASVNLQTVHSILSDANKDTIFFRTQIMESLRNICLFECLPNEINNKILLFSGTQAISYASQTNHRFHNFFKPYLDISQALNYAAQGENKDVIALINMLKKSPELLLQRGNVINRGGVDIRDKTIYEFLLGEGDLEFAEIISRYFSQIKIEDKEGNEIDGTQELQKQYARYEPHLRALALQIIEKKPTYDLTSLIEIIKQSPVDHVRDALNNLSPDEAYIPNTPLRSALAQFRSAVNPLQINTSGMHYQHYTTLLQALTILEEGNDIFLNREKCLLIWKQVVGYLQRSLPAIDRIAFATMFQVREWNEWHIDRNNRTLKCDISDARFPDATDVGIGFTEAVYGIRGDNSFTHREWYPPAKKWAERCDAKAERVSVQKILNQP